MYGLLKILDSSLRTTYIPANTIQDVLRTSTTVVRIYTNVFAHDNNTNAEYVSYDLVQSSTSSASDETQPDAIKNAWIEANVQQGGIHAVNLPFVLSSVTIGQSPMGGGGSGGSYLTAIVQDTTPQLGGNLDTNGFKIVSVSNRDIDIEPDGTGDVLLGNYRFDADQTVGAGQDDYVLTYDNATSKISLEAAGGGGVAEAIMTNGDVMPCSSSALQASYKTTTLVTDRLYAVPFWVGGQMSVTHIGIQSGAAPSGTISHDIYGAIYKYSATADEWSKVVQVGAFTNGVEGKQSIALGSTQVLSQGIYAMVMHSDGAQAAITGHYVQTLQNILPAFQTGTAAQNGYYLYQALTPTATLPATLTNASFSIWPYNGHLVPSCYLTLG